MNKPSPRSVTAITVLFLVLADDAKQRIEGTCTEFIKPGASFQQHVVLAFWT